MKFQLRPPARVAWAAFCLLSAIFDAGAAGTNPALQRYLIRFDDVPLARYNGAAQSTQGAQASLIPQRQLASGRARLDVASAPAIAYRDFVRGRQAQHLADVAAAIGRVPETIRTMQHALSAAVVMLTPAEASRLAGVTGVSAVEPEIQLPLSSDVGPTFTSAAAVWWGARAGEDTLFASSFATTAGYRGDGVVVGDLDGGYNSASPSFQSVDLSGKKIANPLGSGHFLGQCGVAGISIAPCNDKVIGVYDEVGLTSGPTHAPYTVEDPSGHGSHTASIAAGNLRMAELSGYVTTIAGVAPRANLVVYRVCTTSCGSTAIVAGVDDAIADGVVDALNFSIGGLTDSWGDPVSQAFLSAVEAGIFVAAAGGNGTQAAGSVVNTQPWAATIAASLHSGGALVTASTSTYRAPALADELWSDSLIGPAPYDVIKPDMQAPGIHILAAVANDGTAGGPALVGMKDGTSMATAHMTGAGALLLGAHPTWSPVEVKSALMLTAKEAGLTKANGTTPSDFFDRGAGRLQEFAASNAGVVMNETGANFSAVNPDAGGDLSTLNLASMQKASCSRSCAFSRTFRSTQNHSVTWTVSVVAAPVAGLASVSATPAKFTLAAGAVSAPVVFSADTHLLPSASGFRFADVVLTPDDKQLSTLHLPLAVAVP